MVEYNKLLFAGPFGAGKTTAIRSISSSAPVSTETALSGGAEGSKTTTTVAMDYSFINLDGATIHIYGMPGQERLAFMRQILAEGAIGAILLLDASRDSINEDARDWLHSLTSLAADIPIVIGVTKTDTAPAFSLNQLRQSVSKFAATRPVLSVDARVTEDIQQLIRMVLVLHDTDFEASP